MPIAPGTHLVYTVRPGDTLYTIAQQHGSSVPAIQQSNMLYPPFTDPGLIFPGQKLVIPLPGMSQQSAVIYQVAEGDTLYRIGERFSAGVDMLAALNQIEQPDILQVARLLTVPAFIYAVEQGDSLYRISRRLGVPLSEIVRANQGRFGVGDVIYPGYLLIVPLPSSTNILVTSPLPGTHVGPGRTLSGRARAFEAALLYQIRDAAGRVVTREKPFMTDAGAPSFGAFSVPLVFDVAPSVQTGTILVYTRSPRDGSIQDLVEVSVMF